MAVPALLRPTAIHAMWNKYENVETPLAKYFPMVPSKSPGPFVNYDVHTYSRQRGRVNSRTGPPNYEKGATDTVVTYAAETWRDALHINPETLKDMRRPGSSTDNRVAYEVADSVKSLRLRYERFLEWLRSQAIVGVKTFYPPGLDETYTELLLCSETCIVSANAYAWNTAYASEAAARTNLEGIRGDFTAARNALAAVGCTLDTLLLNSTTRAYLDANAMMAGIDWLHDAVLKDGFLTRLFGVNIETNDETYVHPITGTATDYIADNDAIFLDSNNERSGRAMVECEPVHVNAPAGARGLYIDTWEQQEAPGGINVNGEWTGGPMVAEPCSMYILTDVTAGP
ncbi:MAG: major capsid protein [Anaerovoracaceae bacterium]